VSAPAPPGPDAPEPRWDRRRTAGALVGGAIVIGIVLLLVVGLINSDEIGSSIQDALAKGERPAAPAVSLPVLAAADGLGPGGSTISTADLRGRVVVLNFWASWCQPCELEAPILEQVARRYRRAGDVVVVGVDVQDLREKALGFVRDNGLTYPSLRDGSDSARRAYQVAAMPETFVVDPQGRIALKVPGQVTRPEQLTNAIDQLRRERS
jgi:cytochrome c biogenesis protein CcmG, thiol:disulfide interchange protein DsbE